MISGFIGMLFFILITVVILCLILSLLFNPFFFVIIVVTFSYMLYDIFLMEHNIVSYVEETSKDSITIADIIGDGLGVSISERNECKFATCFAYEKIENLLQDGTLTTRNLNGTQQITLTTIIEKNKN